MKKVVFYSQNREDLYIKSFFPDLKNGFYVDIGAFDPVYHSVTKLFYDEGWSGINVEPQKFYINKLQEARARDINLQVGVSDIKGELTLRDYKGGGLSTFSENIKKEYEDDPLMNKVSYKDYSVEVVTLDDVYNKVPTGRKVNFLKIDVEGFEYEVFKSNDWRKNRPELICVESNHIQKDWNEILHDAKYIKVFFDGLNEYYLAEESKNRLDLFNFPKMFLHDSEIIPYDLSWQITDLKKELKNTYAKVAKMENEIMTLHVETKGLYKIKENLSLLVHELQNKIELLETEKQSVMHNSKQLARTVKSSIKKRNKKS